ncbi:Holliday junction resolvase RecU [Bacillus sp. DTU_2020_1000418_1_SI_GHA_SEK_038]|uniref:Holliday junction resolvase RecU n=1 Tax=Bacillus sp. DTU_2020_1000418_1_SI_GHA_SEK_038 TaxID=3077585 RepID=UPI0028E2E880|nr:Holliday junction resolvase RecU [Bacillus sp. DTU_2020_1000418_1_SI_GHA_SEK_038]WNS73996.1 Holliday junction resolvase RecU [Bacillus sp. DTU_2020_1000418_1_SI_GHA_SEK_038]
MNFHYPNGKKFLPVKKKSMDINKEKKWSYSNRGMTLEEDINETNEYYLANGIASIHKKPTPVQIVQVDYPKRSAAVIKEAYFKQASTTDYNGVYKGRYIDFEAKETKNLTSFPLKNFHDHQIVHMETILKQDGICFVLLRFSSTEDIFLLEAEHLLMFWKRMKDGGRKSITKDEIEALGHQIPLGYNPRIDYIKKIDYLYSLG